MRELVLILLQKDKEALSDVRCFPGLRIAEFEGQLWLRGIPASEKPDLKIRKLPAVISYFLDHENRLFPCDSLTPAKKLPGVIWISLQEFLTVRLPVAAMPGIIKEKALIQLYPLDQPEKGNALLTSLTQWKAYAEAAAEVRLEKIQFAVSDNDEVVLIGDPLPPIPGKEFYIRDFILLPCGYDFGRTVISALLSKKLNPQQDCFLLFSRDGRWEKIPHKNFVAAKRSAVRLTKYALRDA